MSGFLCRPLPIYRAAGICCSPDPAFGREVTEQPTCPSGGEPLSGGCGREREGLDSAASRVCPGISGQSLNLWSLSLLTCKMATMLTNANRLEDETRKGIESVSPSLRDKLHK